MTMILAAVEGLAMFAALCLVNLGLPLPAFSQGFTQTATVLGLSAALAVDALVALYYADCYELRVVPNLGRFLTRLPRAMVLLSGPLAAAYVLYPDTRAAVVWTALLMGSLVPGVRAALYRGVRSRWFTTRVLIIGSGPLAGKVVEAIEGEMPPRDIIIGVVDDGSGAPEPITRYPFLGPIHALDKIIEATAPERVVVALEERRRRLPVRPLLEARLGGILVDEGAEFYERLTGKVAIEALTPSSLIFSTGFCFRPPRLALLVGRVSSVLVALLGLVVCSPVLALLALLIRLDSRGPIFFVQERLGRCGRRFKLIKFRTMHVIAAPPSEWAGDNSDRITRIGHWLRKFRLDELPQFVNILRGDMDLVGPRPHPVSNFSLFVTVLRNSPECGEQIPYYSLRCLMRPGMTGWAQVRYRYANNLEEEIEKMRYDLYYVKHRSLWLDLRILAETVKTVLAGSGSMDAVALTTPAPAAPPTPWTLAPQPALAPPRTERRSVDAT
jgi:exopolysaccharide biosynthesis polyprenyl glycosylphosphotransferase